jgi:hypothetical protein
MSLILSIEELENRRQARRRLRSGLRIATDEQAAQYVNERGFAMLMRLPRLALPSLSEADVRDPWEGFDITDGAWRWKETLPGARLCAYQKLVQNRGTFISWNLFPHFYVLYGPQDVYEEEYRAGLLERLAYLTLQEIEEKGPLSSRDLWAHVRGEFGGKRPRFEGVLSNLQRTFHLTVSGGSLEGWSLHYWDLVERQAPAGLLDKLPSIKSARESLLCQFIENMVAAGLAEMHAAFRWDGPVLQETLTSLVVAGRMQEAAVEGRRERLWALHEG